MFSSRKTSIFCFMLFLVFQLGFSPSFAGGFDDDNEIVDPYRQEKPVRQAVEMPMKKAPIRIQGAGPELRPESVNKFDKYDEDDQIDPYIKEKPVRRVLEMPMEKPPIRFKAGDLEATFGGKMKIEYDKYHNMKYLNCIIPDDFQYFKQTIDLSLNLIYGQKKYGHKALEMFFNLRSKNKWGLVGAYKNTSPTEIKLGGVSLGEHVHRNSRPNPWFKDAWMQMSLNSILKSKHDKLHFLKIGWFPFSLGRGVAFGPFYATVYEELGLFSYPADASAPGINLNGELFKDILWYDLYYAKFEDNSSSSAATFNNTIKKNQFGRKKNPWRGEAKDDELWAARLRWLAFDCKKKGSLRLEPYIFFNEASDQMVEVAADTKTQLGSYGLEGRYRSGSGKFKIGGEIAANYGSENLRKIDRNKATLSNITNDGDAQDVLAALIYKAHSHVVANNAEGYNAPINNASNEAVDDYRYKCLDSDTPYPFDGESQEMLKNKSNRIRPAYKNDFRGWMGIVDTRYRLAKNFKIAGEYGYASGDENPHKVEKDKNYDGFIGLHELYAGKRVTSVLVLGEREVLRPMSLTKGAKEVDGFRATNNTTFTDLHYFGLSATWKPEKYRKHRFKINPNALLFWKANSSYKYCFDCNEPDNSQVSCTEKASRFMGTELNLILSYELLKDLTLGAIFSVFCPGSFYKDVKGVPIGRDYYRDTLSSTVRNCVNAKNYRINDDAAFFGVLSLEYKF